MERKVNRTHQYIREAELRYRRRRVANSVDAKKPIRSARDVVQLARWLQKETREKFYVLLLDGKNRLIAQVPVAIGTLNGCPVHAREVFSPALHALAAAVILVHNHPSGDATPSRDDLALTSRIVEAGKLLGIQVLDHVIIGDHHVSLTDRGLIGR